MNLDTEQQMMALEFVAFFVALYLTVKYAVRNGVISADAYREKEQRRPLAAFPVVQAEELQAVVDDGPGKYRVAGIDRDSTYATEFVTEARSREDAMMIAEGEGIIATAVVKVG